MNFHVLTLFPDMVMQGVNTSITGRAIKNSLVSVEAVNIRDFADNAYGQVDDYPYGGGAGMLIKPGPVYDSYKSVSDRIGHDTRVVYMTPQGRTLDQNMVCDFSKEEDLIILCGHYEGIDERVVDMIVTDNVSIGDYVLTGGELAAMVLIDAVSRMVPGVLGNGESPKGETFSGNLVEYPQYTRPEVFRNQKVPSILLSGDHAKVDRWRREKSLERTFKRRPDLLEKADLDEKDQIYLARYRENTCKE